MSAGVLLGQASRLGIECADCGRNRWRTPEQMLCHGVTLHTALSVVAKKFSCSACRESGLPGKNVSVQVYFNHDADRLRAEAEVLRNQAVLSAGSRAKGF